ncbi:MAG: TrbC/VirB2 family protein [Rickettsia endosymbiont of Ixodes persulcatus]|nr:TrbC/VirB2 family protein [Rickettsia endosymbiont of Ixodes persulcatus]MCZ6909188.1 TrbC/VirB2 family protein [Rickettsia endosymbiont of Ixodes persulcatus]MCZ6910928.1 TrbC/VirB2 family protein [Rickettsia endosymbiont of Ixodes persulcatus]MCZ6915049.1 TrbC/VirB2 family protein [Rickettsia endosymbiont of Ixodes persulcatus]MCZ6919740.1 TrbC/VirB2 family protein [Rickettsia endosymbiont of Ixodes persulcatus]
MNFPIRKLNEELIDYNLSLRILFTILSVAIIMIAFDSLGSNGDPVGDALCKLIKVFRGNTAKGIAVVGMIVLGIQTLRGKLQWEVALVVVTAIIILFKAPDIVNMVSSDTNNSNCGVS